VLGCGGRALGQGVPDSSGTARDSLRARAAQQLTAVIVTPGTYGLLSPVRGSAQSLGREAILTRPQLGEDLFRSIQRLPGLASSDLGAAFHVRGAEVNQLHVSLDGLELYEPFHMKDFDNALSILDVRSVEGIDLVTSGFTSEYGGRLGSVLSIRSRAPRTDRMRTSLGVSVSNLRAQAEGGFSDGRGGWSLAARRGYLDLALRLAGRSDSLSPTYNDLFATVTWEAGARHRIAAHALLADDVMEYRVKDGGIASRYASRYGWVTWDADITPLLTARTVASVGRLAWARTGDAQIVSGGPRSTVDDDRSAGFAGLRQDWMWSASERVILKFGAEWKPARAEYEYDGVRIRRAVIADTIARIPTLVSSGRSVRGSQLGAYVAPRLRPVRWLVAELGVRYDRTTWSGDASVSPRGNVMLTLSPATTLRLAAGRYSQPRQAFALQVQDGVTEFGREDVSQHRVIGLEHRLGRSALARVEAYERRLTRQEPRFINLRGDLRVFPELEPDRILLPATSGRARGLEFSLRGLGRGGVDWAASYAYARVTDRVGTTDVARTWDQPHSVYLDATWRPKGGQWHFSIASQAHSGWPESPVRFVLDTVRNAQGVKATTVLTVYGPVTELGTQRLPWYHRVDARVTRDATFRRWHVSGFVDVFNVFDKKNPAAIRYKTSSRNNRVTVTRVPELLLGWLPSAGITVEF
jgi:hypothetical protein